MAKLVERYYDIFSGMGEMKGVTVTPDVDKNVKPIAQKHRRVPFHMRESVEKELTKLLNGSIIEKVESSATEWISPIVMVPKPSAPGEYQLGVGMTKPNNAIKRIRHVIPTMEELRHDFNGCKMFSKIDLNQGYHQLLLHESSRAITTFSTHAGLFHYKRLNFGTCSAAEIFHEEVRKRLVGIPLVRNQYDDY